jgi:peptidoglycan/LPS O-acetylase OafA/YrhL
MLLVELARHQTINFRRFYKRRAIRLFPALLVVLVAHFAMAVYYKENLWTEFRTDLFALSFTANYQRAVGITPPWDLNIVWSLAIEGQFYLLWPFTVWVIYRFVKTPWGMVAAMVPLVVPLAVLRYWQYTRWGWLLVYDRTEGRLPAFILGGVLAVLWCYDLIPRRVAVYTGTIGGLVLASALWLSNFEQPYRYPHVYALLNISGMCLVATCLFNDSILARLLSPRIFRLAGRVSYSFYLVHAQVFIWVLFHRPHWSTVERVVGALAITLVLGTLCFLIAERPILGRPNLRRGTSPPEVPAPG